MRTEQLKYFISIAETRSINKTSLEFYTTHQGIGKAIRQLEGELGVPLFTRNTKGMELTEEGKIFLPAAKRCIRELHAAQLQLLHHNKSDNLEGALHIWGTPLTNALVLPSFIEDFSVIHPKVRYHVEETNSLDILQRVSLHRNHIGLVVILHDPALQDIYSPYLKQVARTPLQKDEYICVAGKSSPIAERKSISFAEFSTYPIASVISKDTDDDPINQLLDRLGNTKLSLATPATHLCVQAITSGNFLGISSRRSRSEVSLLNEDDVVIIPFEEDLSLDLALVTNTRPALDEIGEAFVELVKEHSTSL